MPPQKIEHGAIFRAGHGTVHPGGERGAEAVIFHGDFERIGTGHDLGPRVLLALLIPDPRLGIGNLRFGAGASFQQLRQAILCHALRLFPASLKFVNTKAGDDRRAAKDRNAQLAAMEAEKKVVDLQVARIQRQERRDAAKRGQPIPVSPEVRAAEQARFEEWANARRAELQNSRLEAEGEQGRTHEREKLALKNEQAINYGSLKKQATATLAAIGQRQQERQERKGLGGLLSRLSGAARRDSERAGIERATLANIERRENEQTGALTARQHAEKAGLSGEHAQEQARLERRIERARGRREAEGWQPHRETRREATTGREAENLPVERRDAGTGQTTPENEQATHAPPEAAHEGKKPETAEERQAAIDAERAAREERDRAYEQEMDAEYPWRQTPEERKTALDARRERERGEDGGRGRERER